MSFLVHHKNKKNSTLELLGIQGAKISLSLNTMYRKIEIPEQKIEGLVVQKFDQTASIDLPKTLSRDFHTFKKNQTPSPEIAAKWPQLERIKQEIPPMETDVEVGILIGCNSPKALKLQEVILGNNGDPYAVRTLLGWGIIGPVSPGENLIVGEDDSSTCHRVVTCEIGSTRLDNRFVVDAQTKATINPFAVKRMFELDLSECDKREQAYSQED